MAAYQKFKINLTGAQFYFVSVHLNSRHGTPTSTETSYSQLRTNKPRPRWTASPRSTPAISR